MSEQVFHDGMALGEARARMRDLVFEGCRCPTCMQFAKVYKRPIHSAMARGLIRLYREVGRTATEIARVLPTDRGGDLTKLRYWRLIEEIEGRRDDGSTRVGVWRITELGEDWIHERVTVPKHALVYDSRLLRLEGDPVTIRDALGKRFNYDELMGRGRDERAA